MARYIPRHLKELDRKDIEYAMSKTLSNKEAARFMNVSYQTYRKYAIMYVDEESGKTLFDKHLNRGGKNTRKVFRTNGSKSRITDILEGRLKPTFFAPKKLKELIIREGYLKEECNICKFADRRVLDMKVPLILNFKDGDKKNWLLTNLEFLCYNHYFIWIGDIFDKKQLEALEDSTILSSRAIDFELPEEHEKALRALVNVDNKGRVLVDEKRPDNFGDDLIVSYIKR